MSSSTSSVSHTGAKRLLFLKGDEEPRETVSNRRNRNRPIDPEAYIQTCRDMAGERAITTVVQQYSSRSKTKVLFRGLCKEHEEYMSCAFVLRWRGILSSSILPTNDVIVTLSSVCDPSHAVNSLLSLLSPHQASPGHAFRSVNLVH